MREGEKEVVIEGTIPHYILEGDVFHFSFGIGYRCMPQLYIDATVICTKQANRLYNFHPQGK